MSALRGILRHKGVRWIGLGWTGFIVENLVMSENREIIINHFGERGYHTAYSFLSTAATSSIIYGYFRYGRKQGPIHNLWNATRPSARLAAFSLHAIGLIGVSQLLPKFQNPILMESSSKTSMRCPFDWSHSEPEDEISGIERVSRHPAFYAMAFIGLGSAIGSVFAAEVVAYSMPTVTAVVLTNHQDSRYRRGIGGLLLPEKDRLSSNLPFLALITGKQQWYRLYEDMKLGNVAIAIAGTMVWHIRRLRRL